MSKHYCTAIALIFLCIFRSMAQTNAVVNPRPLTMAEYQKAKTFAINDPDKDTYVKYENRYILDRYEMRKPYFITGDDGLKKRIDLYKLYAKDSMQELGLAIFYTNEKGKRFTAIQPSSNSASVVWEQYFEDIHAIDKEEKNFVLKLSYVLSKEMSFQLYKALNKETAAENGTYGTEICFPGDQLVTMANGSQQALETIKPGDQVLVIDPVTQVAATVTVKELTSHEARPYALTRLLLIAATETETENSFIVSISSNILEATPNHPVQTRRAKMKIGEVATGDQLICYDKTAKTFRTYTVYDKTEIVPGRQKVYNIVAADGETMIINNVMVLQK